MTTRTLRPAMVALTASAWPARNRLNPKRCSSFSCNPWTCGVVDMDGPGVVWVSLPPLTMHCRADYCNCFRDGWVGAGLSGEPGGDCRGVRGRMQPARRMTNAQAASHLSFGVEIDLRVVV